MPDVIVVDCESTGLEPWSFPVEVAWYNLMTDEHCEFIPPHDQQWVLDNAHPDALEKNHYKERILGQPQDDGTEGKRLRELSQGAVLLGSNVRQDAQWLMRMFAAQYGIVEYEEPWKYRLVELGSLAMFPMRRPIDDPPGLFDVCQFLGVEPGDHSAMHDVMATVKCVKKLQTLQAMW